MKHPLIIKIICILLVPAGIFPDPAAVMPSTIRVNRATLAPHLSLGRETLRFFFQLDTAGVDELVDRYRATRTDDERTAYMENLQAVLTERKDNPLYKKTLRILERIFGNAYEATPAIFATYLLDLGVETSRGPQEYADSIKKVIRLLPMIKTTGFNRIYAYGLFPPSKFSEAVHQVTTSGKHYVRSGNATTIVNGYETKKIKIGEHMYRDVHGNIFSIPGITELNYERLHAQLRDNTPQIPEQPPALLINARLSESSAAEDLLTLRAEADRAGIGLVFDGFAWIAPDAIDAANYRLTVYKELSPEEKEQYQTLTTEQSRQRYIDQILDRPENYQFCAVRITENNQERPILVVHLRGFDKNADQALLNVFLPEVQQYLINSYIALIDAGATGIRIDLAHELLKHNFVNQIPADLRWTLWSWKIINNPELSPEPWETVFSAVNAYAEQKNKTIELYLETYADYDKRKLQQLAADKPRLHIMNYDDRLFHAWYEINQYDHHAGILRDAVNHLTLTLIASKDKPSIATYASNFDQIALSIIENYRIGLMKQPLSVPRDGMKIMLLVLRQLGVPVMIDIRDFIEHSGQINSIAGGTNVHDAKHLHLPPTAEEIDKRSDFTEFELLVRNSRWTKLIRSVYSKLTTKEERFITGLDNSNLDRFIGISWKTEKNTWIVFVLNTKKDLTRQTIWIETPIDNDFSDGYTARDVLTNRPFTILTHNPYKKRRAVIDNLIFDPGEEWKLIELIPHYCDYPHPLLGAADISSAVSLTPAIEQSI